MILSSPAELFGQDSSIEYVPEYRMHLLRRGVNLACFRIRIHSFVINFVSFCVVYCLLLSFFINLYFVYDSYNNNNNNNNNNRRCEDETDTSFH